MQDKARYNDQQERLLLERSAAGDRQAFNTLYELSNKKVYGYIRKTLNNEADAEDVFVETFYEVWRSAKKFKGDSKVSSWMIGIARNLCMNHLKRNKPRDIPQDVVDYHEDEDMLDHKHRIDITRSALSALSMEHREILSLVLLPEFSYVQISELLKIPVNTVKTRVYYAKNALRKQLQGMGVTEDDI